MKTLSSIPRDSSMLSDPIYLQRNDILIIDMLAQGASVFVIQTVRVSSVSLSIC